MKNPISVGNSYTPTTHFIVLCLSLFTKLNIHQYNFLVEEDTILQGLQAYRVHGPGFSHSMPQYTATLRPHVCVTVNSMCFIRSPQLLVTDKGSVTCYKSGVFSFFSPFFKLFSKEEDDIVALPLCFPQKGFRNHKFPGLPLFL